MLDPHLQLKWNRLSRILGYRLRFYHRYKTYLVCLWIGHVGLIQICISPAATVSRVSEKESTCFR